MASFKIFFSPDNIRRFRTETTPDFEKFVRLLSIQYPLYFHQKQRIQYIDTENDKIDITTEMEWVEMFQELKNQKIFKIFILDCPRVVGGGGFFTDEVDDEKEKTEEKQNIENPCQELESRVLDCLREIFPQNKILPNYLPTYLQDITKITSDQKNGDMDIDIDIDIDITQLYHVLFEEGLSCLNRKDYTQGRDIFRGLCRLQPKAVTCHYNLACAEALLGNVENSLNSLQKAVDLGWMKLEDTLKDEDLSSLRNTEGFIKICDEIADRLKITSEKSKNYSVPGVVVVSEKSNNYSAPVVVVPDVSLTNSYEPTPPPPSSPLPLSPEESKWEVQLELLHDFGFLNNSLLVPFLEKNDGSVERTVLDLLDI